MKQPPPPRLYCILAAKAPVALVFRRGPTDWFHLLRWWLDDGRIEPGAWIEQKLFPRKCELSAGGDLMLFYFAGGIEGSYSVRAGVSRIPWLHPLVSWEEGDTFGTGWCFADDNTTHTGGDRQEINLPAEPIVIQRNKDIPFLNERRRGWVRLPESDARGCVVLQRENASAGLTLRLIGGFHDFSGGTDGFAPKFELQSRSGDRDPLPDVAWADWDHQGRLLTATRDGKLRIEHLRDGARTVVVEHDLRPLKPSPQPAPEWAKTNLPAEGN